MTGRPPSSKPWDTWSRMAKSPPSDLKRPGRDCLPVQPLVQFPVAGARTLPPGPAVSPPAVDPSLNCPASVGQGPEGLFGPGNSGNGAYQIFLHPSLAQNQAYSITFMAGNRRLPRTGYKAHQVCICSGPHLSALPSPLPLPCQNQVIILFYGGIGRLLRLRDRALKGRGSCRPSGYERNDLYRQSG